MYNDMPVCDLRDIQSVETAKAIKCISDIAVLILPKDAPQDVMEALEAIPKEDIGTVVKLSLADNISVINGLTVLYDGDIPKENPPVYIVNGTLICRTLSPEKNPRVIVNGAIVLHESLKDSVGIQILVQNGVKIYVEFEEYKSYSPDLEVDADFLKYVNPKTLLIAGRDILIDEDVSPEMLLEKSVRLIAGRTIKCPKKLLGIVKSIGIAGKGFEQ